MTSDASTGDGVWLQPGKARQQALRILGESGHLAPSPDGAAIAYAVLALGDAIADAQRYFGDVIEQAVNSLDASMSDLGRELGRHME